jgi:hypothetical protein
MMHEILELDYTLFRIFAKEMIYVVLFIDLRLIECKIFHSGVDPVHLFLIIIIKGDDAARVGRIPLTKTQEEIAVSEYCTISLFKPNLHANRIRIKCNYFIISGGFVEYNTGHAISCDVYDQTVFIIKAAAGFAPANSGFADRRLATWLCRRMILLPQNHGSQRMAYGLLSLRRAIGYKPFTVLLSEGQSGRRDLNPRPSPWQGDAPPLSYSRIDR